MEELIKNLKEKYETLVYLSSRVDDVTTEPILEETPFKSDQSIQDFLKS
jgi:aromatic ring hydroxylase